MKKQLLLVSFVCLLGQQIYGLTDKEVLRGIVSNHTRTLDRRNMYERRLDNQDLLQWDQAIMDVQTFVEENSKKLKKQLINYFNEIRQANDDLVNGIKMVYGMVGGGQIDNNTRVTFRKKFIKIDADMKEIQKSLDWIGTNDESEQQAIKLVSTLAKFVGVTGRKAANNLDFIPNN